MKENVFIVPEGTKVITRGIVPQDVTKVVIPDTVIEIGDDAFDSCKDLSEISIPNSITDIGERAFYSCNKLSFTTLPSELEKIGVYAFGYCTASPAESVPKLSD